MTALFKLKTAITECPYTDEDKLKVAADREVPNPYYFERGDHRDEIPIMSPDKCVGFFQGQMSKKRDDMLKGFVENNNTCGLAMVKIGRVDRDYGPKSIEDAMISFLDSQMYNTSVMDLKDAVDSDQFIKNIAVYAVMLNLDSPINAINNWYLATTSGGTNDWRIVQYDHNLVGTRGVADLFCSPLCGARQIYWPILRPTCGAVEDHLLIGRILNDETSRQKYLDYIQAFVTNIASRGTLLDLRAHGDAIKEFIVDDPLNFLSISEYEESELSSNFDDYNTLSMPFLKVMEARLEQVQIQLDAIRADTLPRDGIYDKDEVCPDWRDSSGNDYIRGSTVDPVNCPFGCEEAALCFDNNLEVCSPEGDLVIQECKAASPFCDRCYPYSRCGSDNDKSSVFEEGSNCGPEFSLCADASFCFDHKGGRCAYDGDILGAECGDAKLYCKQCFPNSRCALKSLNPTNSPPHTPTHEHENEDPTSSAGSFLVVSLRITALVTAVLSV